MLANGHQGVLICDHGQLKLVIEDCQTNIPYYQLSVKRAKLIVPII